MGWPLGGGRGVAPGSWRSPCRLSPGGTRAALVMVTPWVPRCSALKGERLREGCMCLCKGVLVSPPLPRLDLVPINRSVGLKAKPSKPVTEVLRPVAAKYGLRLSELVARLVSDQADGVTGTPVLQVAHDLLPAGVQFAPSHPQSDLWHRKGRVRSGWWRPEPWEGVTSTRLLPTLQWKCSLSYFRCALWV